MRHRVEIQARPTSYNNLGQHTAAFATIATVAAEVLDLSGRELERARQIVPEATVSVTIRFLASVVANCQIKFRGRTLKIAAVVDPDNRQEYMICLCGEKR